jgi:hypothetical protein
LVDGERVEELVGDDDRRPVGQRRDVAVPDRGAGKSPPAAPGAAGSSRRGGRWPPREGRPKAAAPEQVAINVPRPGPSSARTKDGGDPIASHVATAQRPTSSPNTWLTSGAVTKSPALPNGSRVM